MPQKRNLGLLQLSLRAVDTTTSDKGHLHMSDLEENLRPRPINGSEESDEESSSDSERGRGDSKKPRTNPPEAAESAPEQPKKATVKRKPAFSEDDLVKAKGLLKVYDEFPRRCQYKGKGREVRAFSL